MKKGKVPVI